ncbi:ABC transporter ATP-binding protein [Mesomycoplasma lagogenitalium]|uniref:ABC transporter ATP-binding protein n=1 Tax=Mesomycoplasma lagogenitalium TaxID=171286 RepID=A0ABY8LWH5_9BACT|nr:ABC transporter ATP-binding protein [Mesomycoplasma lagogenitalium]WGI36648.1 ABC transporter ATP-binding protein [Mesomycoplasma lagogenitalium]
MKEQAVLKNKISLWKITERTRFFIIVVLLTTMSEIVMQLFMPFFVKNLIDEGIVKQNLDVVVKFGSLLIGMAVGSLMLGVLGGVFIAKISAILTFNIRKEIFNNVQKFSFGNIDKFSTGAILNRMLNDANNVQTAFIMMIRAFVRAIFMLIGALFFSFSQSPQLSMMFLVIIPILIITSGIIWWKAFPIYVKLLKKYDEYNFKLQENLSGIRTIKSYTTEKHEASILEKIVNKVMKSNIKSSTLSIYGQVVTMGIIFASLLSVAIIGKQQILDGKMEIGLLAAFVSYVWQVTMSLMLLTMVFSNVALSIPSWKRIKDIINEESKIDENINGKTEIKNGNIRFENVFMKYHEEEGYSLEDINIDIKHGQTIGVIGQIGSGKTTFVSLISRLYDTTKGQVFVGDEDVKNYNVHSLRDAIAVVLQKNTLFKGTIRSNLKWGKQDASDQEMYEALENSGILDFVKDLEKGLDSEVEQGGNNFSGGQKQRLSIARALIKKPKILILDDSTSAVDAKTEKQIRNAFNTKINDCTKIIISQRVSSIEQSDKIVVLNEGKILAVGTHQELLNNCEFYAWLNETQKSKGGYGEIE